MKDQNIHYKQIEEALRIKTEQLNAVTRAMTRYLESGNWREASTFVLRSALDQTESEYGFIGVVVEGPVLRILVHEGIVWDKNINREFYEQAVRTYHEIGYLEFTNFNNLFGKVITSGKPVLSNDPIHDPHSGGTPPGHPPLRCFLGVPILKRGEVIGMIGVANRPKGYDGTELGKIQILTEATGILYDSYRRQAHESLLETERKKAEKEMGSLAAIVESSEDAIIGKDLEGRITSWNRGAERLYGYKAQEIVGKSISILVPPECVDELPHLLEKLKQGEPIQQYETVRRRKDDTRVDVAITISPVINSAGQVIGGSVTARDITERKRAAERFRMVVEAAPSAMIMVDKEGRINLVNQQTERLFGYTREELIGQRIELLVPGRFRSKHPGYREGFFQEPESRPMGAGRDLFGLKKDGGEVPIEISLNPIETSEGLFTLASIIDITERKRAEETLLQAQAQLIQASKLASVGTLAAGVAHELNNPLAGILGFSQDIISLLQGGQFDIKEVLEEAKLIERDAHRCQSIIENLSMFARLKSREIQWTDINSLLDEILPLVEQQITLQGIQIIKQYQSDLPKIEVNQDDLQQVFVNLILNARQALKKGGKLTIATRTGGHFLEIEFSDTGVGISSENLDMIFDPFFTTHEIGEGSGLGLSISYEIIQRHNGRMKVHSEGPNKGTTVVVELPIPQGETGKS